MRSLNSEHLADSIDAALPCRSRPPRSSGTPPHNTSTSPPPTTTTTTRPRARSSAVHSVQSPALSSAADTHGGQDALIGAGVGAVTGNLLGRSKDAQDERRAANGAAAVSQMNQQAAAMAVTNYDLLQMTRAGISEDVIISTMRSRGARIDLSPQALIATQATRRQRSGRNRRPANGLSPWLHSAASRANRHRRRPAAANRDRHPRLPTLRLLLSPALLPPLSTLVCACRVLMRTFC